MIDVGELIRKYSVEELNETAEAYYKSMNPSVLARKPFIIPGLQHLLVEVSYLVTGLNLRPMDRVLDFGCGTGWTSRILNACGCEVVGIDVSKTALDLATDLAERWRKAELLDLRNGPSIQFRHYDGLTIPVDDASIDNIFVLDAFHHVPDQAATLREFARVLKPGGSVGMCEPGPHHSQHPDSQREMALHKVVENDIVLDEIEAVARNVGFDELSVCLSPLLPMVVEYSAYKRFPQAADVAQQFLTTTDWRVKNYPVFFLRKAGSRNLDSRALEGMRAHIELRSSAHVICRTGEAAEIRLTVTNMGAATWLPSGEQPGSVNIGYTVAALSGATKHKEHRISLSLERVPPGTQFDVAFHLPLLDVGRHEVQIDLVSEHVGWLGAAGGNALVVTVEQR